MQSLEYITYFAGVETLIELQYEPFYVHMKFKYLGQMVSMKVMLMYGNRDKVYKKYVSELELESLYAPFLENDQDTDKNVAFILAHEVVHVVNEVLFECRHDTRAISNVLRDTLVVTTYREFLLKLSYNAVVHSNLGVSDHMSRVAVS